jgi:trehalose 6-phosphate phosphatase
VTDPKLRAIAAEPSRTAILLDFDGTLAPIVSRPEEAGIVSGGREVLASLVDRYLVVAVISGRPQDSLVALVRVDGVRYEGLYGLAAVDSIDHELRKEVEAAARFVPGAWVEPKGITLAVHYRHSPDPVDARARLAPALGGVATMRGYDLIEGKMVLELAPAGESRKGGAVKRIVVGAGARGALYAGDDLPDLEAFAALDELADEGVTTVKVAVGGAETPTALTGAADIVAPDPRELVALLATL